MLLAAAVPALAQSNGSSGAERPVAGAFTEEQVAKGEMVFTAVCAACHVASDYTGETFKANWLGRTLWDYFASLRKTMPDDNPGSLSDDEYARVVAYILRENGYRAGTDSLPSDSLSLKLIKIGPVPIDTTTKPPRLGARR